MSPLDSLVADSPRSARPQLWLVEDDAGVRRSLQLLLEGEGYGVRAFGTATAFLADQAAGAACLVTDYRLGEQDGIALLRALRLAGWSGPAILMTAFASPAITEQALRAGFGHVLDKPFRPHRLIDLVTSLISGRGENAQD